MSGRRKAGAEQGGKKGKPSKGSSSGGGLFRFLFLLAVLGGVGYAAARIPFGGHTLVEHVSAWMKPTPVAKPSRIAQVPSKEATKDAAKDTTKDVAKAPVKAPVKTAAGKKPDAPDKTQRASPAAPDHKPADAITPAERAELRKLLH